jgi:hypothetical protein
MTIACLLALPVTTVGQGVQTGTISGNLQSIDSLPLPGVTVVATSPDLQGERLAVSDENGVYYFRGLLPGTYDLTFDMPGFQPAARAGVPVSAGGLATVDATMPLATVTETITVTAEAPPAVTTSRTSQTYTKAEIDLLPTGRRPFDVAELSPGVTTNAFNTSALTMAGSFGYDNVFMVNGVDVNDNVLGTSNDLFIEDAIQETTVLTHGVSAEYGRFSGGVVNVVTKSGSNLFSGSFREGLSNPKWIGRTPLEQAAGIEHKDVLSQTHEGTFGGPLVQDRLWFFAAGRAQTANTPLTLAQNGAGYTLTEKNRRGEVKFTGSPAIGQTVQVSYINNATEQANRSGIGTGPILDAAVLTTRQLPNRLFAASYNGAVTSSLFGSLQYSEKKQSWKNNGGTSTDIHDSPMISMGATPGVAPFLFYNAPFFDATDPEQRNNRQVTGSLSYWLTTPDFGTHDIKGGGEYFVSTGVGGNSQSSTGYTFFTDYLAESGAVVRDADGGAIPVFTPGRSQIWTYQASRGAEVDVKTTSFYVQDRWVVTPRLTMDLGTRLEMVRADATGDQTTVDTWSIMPRVGATYDLTGDGQTTVYGTYGHYSGKYSQVQFAVNTNVGRPNETDYVYSGPAGQGGDFAPGFDLANYTQVVFASFPTANVQMADGLKSPLTREFTVGLGRELGDRGYARATYAWRKASRFVEDFLDLTTGVADVPLVGQLTNRVYDNTDDLYRDYQSMVFQSGYRVRDNVTVDGHYTLQLRNHGDFAGEAARQPGIPSVYGNFPEVFGAALDRLNPEGRLDSYQQHKLRVYGTYGQSLGRFGSVDLAPVWRVNSGGVYSLTSTIRVPAAQLARNPGYPTNDINPNVRETVYFGDRGGYDFKGYGVMDFAASYNMNVWRTLRPWLKVEFYNLFNNQKQIAWDKSIAANLAGPLDANGIPTEYAEGPRFGTATSGAHFVQPFPGQDGGRAFRMAFGMRF